MTAEATGSAEKCAPLSSEEQETVISWDRADRTARIYTTDRRYSGSSTSCMNASRFIAMRTV